MEGRTETERQCGLALGTVLPVYVEAKHPQSLRNLLVSGRPEKQSVHASACWNPVSRRRWFSRRRKHIRQDCTIRAEGWLGSRSESRWETDCPRVLWSF